MSQDNSWASKMARSKDHKLLLLSMAQTNLLKVVRDYMSTGTQSASGDKPKETKKDMQ